MVNQPADDFLEALLMKNDIKFLSMSVSPILKVEQPPRLQALLKAITQRIKGSIASYQGEKTRLENDVRSENYV